MEEVNPHVTGELYIKTMSPMMGYYKQQDKTNSVIDENGWIRTGICIFSYVCHARLDKLHRTNYKLRLHRDFLA